MLEILVKLVGRYPKTVIAIVVLMTVYFYFGLIKINIVTEPKAMLPEGNTTKLAFS